ncbi:MAG: FAD:protein FMN transferase [Planctomycetaceae bacterium]|jgi:thiamine biosynthesis lipoprotein|nr:FAD:protein FMN transferase [Planctomycetaceae bacterium]
MFDLKSANGNDGVTFLSVSRRAMNVDFEVLFSRVLYPQGTAAAINALDEIERLEQVLSVFRFDSRTQYINLCAYNEAVKIDGELLNLITQCLQISTETNGAVDITSGLLWKLWGFARGKGVVPDKHEISTALESVDYKSVIIDSINQTIRFLKPSMELNFGCVGKGFAIDVAADCLCQFGVNNFLFHGGFSSILARGKNWRVGIIDPLRGERRLTEVTLSDCAISTSSSQKQFFRYKGRRYSHLIDPRNGLPAEGVFSVTVIAPTGVLAELLSTAFFVMGLEQAEEYQKKHQEISALFILPTKTKNKNYEIKTIGNFPENKE